MEVPLSDIQVYFSNECKPQWFAKPESKKNVRELIEAYEYLITHGAKMFLNRYADKTRHKETLRHYIEAWKLVIKGDMAYKEPASVSKARYYHSSEPLKRYCHEDSLATSLIKLKEFYRLIQDTSK